MTDMGGLRYDDLSKMPPGMRQQVASKILAQIGETSRVAAPPKGKASKYGNVTVQDAGLKFASRKEYRRYLALMDAAQEGVIYDLRMQHNFTLQEGYTTPYGERIRAIVYQADFTYRVHWPWHQVPTSCSADDLVYWRKAAQNSGDGVLVVEDVKSKPTRTRAYINKYKMMAAMGHHIREV